MTTENTGDGGKKHSKLRRQEAVAGWLFVLPAVIFWLVWFLYPAVKAISISFFRYNYATPETNAFIGMENYIRLFQDPKFFEAMQHASSWCLSLYRCSPFLPFPLRSCSMGKSGLKGSSAPAATYPT